MGCSHPHAGTQQTSSSPAACASRQPQKPQEVPKALNFWESYNIGHKLGSGSFAQVRVARTKSYAGAGELAVKIVDLRGKVENSATSEDDLPLDRGCVDKDAVKNTKMEVTIWRKISAARLSSCVLLREVFWDHACCYMVMERCDHALLQELKQTQDYTEAYLAELFLQMAKALQALHTLGVIHRDVKPDNFLVNTGSKVKLADFGFSVIVNSEECLKDAYGTPPFMAPEMLNHQRYREKVDVWSMGVLMYVLIYGEFPYMPMELRAREMKNAIREGRIPPSYQPSQRIPSPSLPSHGLELLIKTMLSRDATARASASDVVQHHYWRQSTQHQSRVLGVSSLSTTSFKPMLHIAMKTGAFSLRGKNLQRRTSTDKLLLHLQAAYRTESSTAFDPDDSLPMNAMGSITSGSPSVCSKRSSRMTWDAEPGQSWHTTNSSRKSSLITPADDGGLGLTRHDAPSKASSPSSGGDAMPQRSLGSSQTTASTPSSSHPVAAAAVMYASKAKMKTYDL
mmetsp:Transcript_52601/g.125628  ORF Transcript_52601/g.125628 Transcript_52601/m.125628 type:complete len:511 (-) Transcript_52601:87-1619(-)